jgi:hypothetical protein
LGIKPEELFDIMMYILKDGDVVCDFFFGCNKALDILHECLLKKGIIFVNTSIEEKIEKNISLTKCLISSFFRF